MIIIRMARLAGVVATGGLLAAGGAAMAQELDSSNFDVTATVIDSCVIESTQDLDISDADVLRDAGLTGSADIEVTCTNGTGYSIALTYSESLTDAEANELTYGLYQDDQHQTDWNDTSVVTDEGTGSSKTHTVYAAVDGGQNTAFPGDYDETVNVTVSLDGGS